MAKPPAPPKQIEKKIEIKELKIEKIEKIEHKEKPEKFEHKEAKFEKNELKEHKIEKIEHKEQKLEKSEIKENSKFENKEFKEFKEFKEGGGKHVPKEKDGKELVENPGDIFDPIRDLELAKSHLSQLEDAAKNLKHFIDNAERPDLGKGALKNEKDG